MLHMLYKAIKNPAGYGPAGFFIAPLFPAIHLPLFSRYVTMRVREYKEVIISRSLIFFKGGCHDEY